MASLPLLLHRVLASGLIPARWVYGDLLRDVKPAARTGRLHLEIVSHCWGYAHLQAYQLSSLVRHPPADIDVTMTVFHAEEDEVTRDTLAFFETQSVPGVRWNWQRLSKQALFRRAIGRHQAALATRADWIWFTDCDLWFDPGCLDALNAALQGRQDRLVYPSQEMLTELLPDDHPALVKEDIPRVKSIEGMTFQPYHPSRATGPLQIVHGDVARAAGYCGQTRYFMQPVERWAKTYEDRTFRWLINDQGTAIDVPGVHRIRHQSKGRYRAGLDAKVRLQIRKATEARRT